MPNAVEPGTRLAGRYRLEIRPRAVGDLSPRHTAGSSASVGVVGRSGFWRAEDEMLRRPVGLRLLRADAPHAAWVLDAARRAAAVADRRFLAILDADVSAGFAYVVTEWVQARDLAELVAAGPLPSDEAQWLAAEVARALAVAHDAGLAHRRLRPESVLRTETGRIKIGGLGVDAALAGVPAVADAQATAEDVHAAGAILYAALTCRWPSRSAPTGTQLAPAPVIDGAACSPRQVRAAVPADLDELACRALGAPLRRGAAAIATPRDLADALLGHVGNGGDPATGPQPPVPPDPDGVGVLAAPERAGLAVRAAMLLVITIVIVGLALLAWQVGDATTHAADSRDESPTPATTDKPTRAAVRPGQLIPVQRVVDFDPEGNGEENPQRLGRVVDADPESAWTTMQYFNSPLGGLKRGVGVVLDLGQPRDVATVTLGLLGRGSDVELRATPDQDVPDAAQGFRRVADADGAGSIVTLRPPDPIRARYLLVWFTSLPPSGEARYRGGITDVRVRS